MRENRGYLLQRGMKNKSTTAKRKASLVIHRDGPGASKLFLTQNTDELLRNL